MVKKNKQESPAQYGASSSRVKVCEFCKHEYVNPCSDKTKASCQNWQFLQQKKRKA